MIPAHRGLAARLTPWVFMTPALAVLAVFFFGSFLEVIRYSLTTYSAFGDPEFVGFDNYARLLRDDRFWTCLGNSFVYLLVTPVLVGVSLLCATIIDAGVRGKNALRLLFFLPVVTPTIVAAVAWRILLHEENGLINAALERIPLLEPVNWLTGRPFSLVSAMLVTLWKGFGFYMMIFLAALLAVPRELKEAMAARWGRPVAHLPTHRPSRDLARHDPRRHHLIHLRPQGLRRALRHHRRRADRAQDHRPARLPDRLRGVRLRGRVRRGRARLRRHPCVQRRQPLGDQQAGGQVVRGQR